MARSKKRNLYVLVESAYSTEPSADGSLYLPVPCLELGDLSDDLELITTDYMTGRDRATRCIIGPDGAGFTFTTPGIGYATAGADGAAPAAVHWFDTLALHYFGNATTTSGEAITGTAATTISTTGVDPWNAHDLVPVYEAGYPSTAAQRSFWQYVTGQSGSFTYDVVPGFADSGPGAGGVGYAVRKYRPDDDGGATLSFVYVEDDIQYTLGGCRVLQFSGAGTAGREWRWSFTVRADSKSITTKASLPAALTAPTPSEIMLAYSPVYFGTTNLGDIGSVEVDFASTAAVLESVNGNANGRAGDELINVRPVVTVNPPRTSTTLGYKRNATQDELLVQIGRGALSGGALNTMCVHFPAATAREFQVQDANGRIRTQLRFFAEDWGAAAPYCQLALA